MGQGFTLPRKPGTVTYATSRNLLLQLESDWFSRHCPPSHGTQLGLWPRHVFAQAEPIFRRLSLPAAACVYVKLAREEKTSFVGSES